MLCPDCRAPYDEADNYCRSCGMYLAVARETVALTRMETRALERQRAPMPAPVKRAVTAVAIGAAMQVGMSLATRYVARQATQRALDVAVRAPAKPKGKGRDARAVAKPEQRAVANAEERRGPVLPEDVGAVAETFVYQRFWVRRGP